MKKIEIKKYQDNLHRYTIHSEEYKYEMPIMLTGDWHFDNPKTKRDLLFKHLDYTKENNGFIIINGDLLCLMQGKYDRRASKSAILQEHLGDNYLDLVINDTAEKLLPYANNILQINKGNHETAVSSRNETDVTQRLVDRINLLAGTDIQVGEYMGMIIINFSYKNSGFKALNIAYDHGHWGGVISKGTQASMRYAAAFPNADIVLSSHTHDKWVMAIPRYVYNSNKHTLSVKEQWHVKAGTYKEEFESGKGWAVEKIGLPKSLGCCFVNVKYNRKENLEFTFELSN